MWVGYNVLHAILRDTFATVNGLMKYMLYHRPFIKIRGWSYTLYYLFVVSICNAKAIIPV